MRNQTLREIQQHQRWRQRLKYYFAWFAWIPAILTLIFAIIDALGYLPPTWGKWIVVVIALLSVGTLLIAIPEKDLNMKLSDSMIKGEKRAEEHRMREVNDSPLN